MHKLIVLVFIFGLTACQKKDWSKQTLVNDCLTEFYKKNKEQKIMDDNKIPYLCDCMADKMLVKYKSHSQANKDSEGMSALARDCALDIMGK